MVMCLVLAECLKEHRHRRAAAGKQKLRARVLAS